MCLGAAVWPAMLMSLKVDEKNPKNKYTDKNAITRHPCKFEALFSSSKFLKSALCKKKILRHIKLTVHAWSTKCRRNQKLIAQFALTLRDESFEPN